MYLSTLLLLTQTCAVLANTEKTIFIGPRSFQIPAEHPTLKDLHLDSLSPQQWSLRTHVNTEFPTNSSQYGQASWFLLHRLQEGQRYEVRVCWAATQPTSFRLDTYELSTVFQTPELISSLTKYSETREQKVGEVSQPTMLPAERQGIQEDASPMLLLQLFSAAEYYTTNKTLMGQVPPVYADLILDPLIFNILPRSLLPTAAYIILIAIGSWYIARGLSGWIKNLSTENAEKKNS
ncbi:hypothetical protein PZA11_003466 [Diplocarpon coronariae]|nr:hypothetical protein JHW43_001892 [Diplocarpon mali]